MATMITFLHRLFGFGPSARTIHAYQGPFAALFRDERGYVTLLSLGPEALPTLQFIADVVRQNPGYRRSVLSLRRDPGWRLHLVAAIAVLLSRDPIDLTLPLWEAMDHGSWVAPQLGVVLSICDPGFISHAKQRIAMGCPVAPVHTASQLEPTAPGRSMRRRG